MILRELKLCNINLSRVMKTYSIILLKYMAVWHSTTAITSEILAIVSLWSHQLLRENNVRNVTYCWQTFTNGVPKNKSQNVSIIILNCTVPDTACRSFPALIIHIEFVLVSNWTSKGHVCSLETNHCSNLELFPEI